MSSDFTGNPTAAESPSPAPGPGVAPIVRKPSDGDALNAASVSQDFQTLADFIAWLTSLAAGPGQFGDGSDGTYTLDGVQASVGGLFSKSGNVYTLLRDAFFVNLTVTGASVQLVTSGFRLYVKGTLMTASGGIVHCNGNAASGNTPGAAAGGNALGVGFAGGTGGVSSGNGSPGGAAQFSLGGSGGTGGNAPVQTGGAGGVATTPAVQQGSIHAYGPTTMGYVVGVNSAVSTTALSGTIIQGGAGGGGGGYGTGNGGGGGSGGGVTAIAARNVVLATSADIQAKGGAGGVGPGTNSGGGAGGGGGVVLLFYWTLTISSGSFSAATNCTGGAGGAGVGTGLAGAAGSNGAIYSVQLL